MTISVWNGIPGTHSVERKANCRNIVGTAEHLALRRRRSTKIVARIEEWRDETAPLFEPRSPRGEALRYMKNQWSRLIAFLVSAARTPSREVEPAAA